MAELSLTVSETVMRNRKMLASLTEGWKLLVDLWGIWIWSFNNISCKRGGGRYYHKTNLALTWWSYQTVKALGLYDADTTQKTLEEAMPGTYQLNKPGDCAALADHSQSGIQIAMVMASRVAKVTGSTIIPCIDPELGLICFPKLIGWSGTKVSSVETAELDAEIDSDSDSDNNDKELN